MPKGIRAPLKERFWQKVDRRGPDDCWPWTGGLSKAGYGTTSEGSAVFYSHRVSYEWAHGPIPTGWEVRSTCRNRACVNPAHLECVSREVRIARGRGHGSETHCPAGHPYDEENTYRPARGGRGCRACRAAGDKIRKPLSYDPRKRRLMYFRKKVRELNTAGLASLAAVEARWQFYGGRCWMCGGEACEVDHVKPLAKGGSNWPANLRPACRSCNAKKHDRWYGVAELWRLRRVA